MRRNHLLTPTGSLRSEALDRLWEEELDCTAPERRFDHRGWQRAHGYWGRYTHRHSDALDIYFEWLKEEK